MNSLQRKKLMTAEKVCVKIKGKKKNRRKQNCGTMHNEEGSEEEKGVWKN